jgi:hypothetical protein
MITDVLPLLPARTGAEPAGYEATARSGSSWASASASASADHTFSGDPFGSLSAADTRGGGEPVAEATAATTPQPVLGDAAPAAYDAPASAYDAPASAYDAPAGGYEAPPGAYDAPVTEYRPPTEYDRAQGGWGQGGSAAGSAAGSVAPPDFSSWYDPAPRSGPAPSAQPWSGPAGPSGGRADYAPAHAPRRRRTGLWLALVLLAVLGAGAGAATIVLLRHNTTGSAAGGSSSPATSSLPPPQTAPQIVDAINEHTTGPLPAGWTTRDRPATSAEVAGFTIGAPANWKASTAGYQTYLYDPSANANILIDLTPHTFPNDMLREGQYIRKQSLAQNRFPGYVGMGLQAAIIRGTHGAWWKFTWDDNGVSQEAIDLLFVLHTPAGAQSYAVYMTAPKSIWNQMRPVFDEEAETFAPLT